MLENGPNPIFTLLEVFSNGKTGPKRAVFICVRTFALSNVCAFTAPLFSPPEISGQDALCVDTTSFKRKATHEIEFKVLLTPPSGSASSIRTRPLGTGKFSLADVYRLKYVVIDTVGVRSERVRELNYVIMDALGGQG